MKKLRIFLTGGGGFIGRNIRELLGEKYTIVAPSHSQLELANSDMVEVFLRTYPVDVIVHTANVGGNRAEATVPNVAAYNLRIFFNLVRNSRYYKKFIYLGSGTQYGKQLSVSRVKEADLGVRIPADEFGLYKYVCARYIEDSALPLLNLVLFGVYGKYEPYQFRFISNALCKAMFDMPITISQNAFFDYLWIDDFVRILDYFISQAPAHRTYNIGSGRQMELTAIARDILQVARKKLPISVFKRGHKEEYTCNTSRLREEIPSFKFTDFLTTIGHLYEYYNKQRNTFDRNSLI